MHGAFLPGEFQRIAGKLAGSDKTIGGCCIKLCPGGETLPGTAILFHLRPGDISDAPGGKPDTLPMSMGMSITTKRGDEGKTDLLFGGRVGKSHPRLHAVGEVDELNAALGLVRVHARDITVKEIVARAQQDLVALMGLLSAGPEHAERYANQGFKGLGADAVERVTAESAALEATFPDGFHGWSMPGDRGGAGAAWLELARCICRRAERAVSALPPEDQPGNPNLIPWLNRLSDLLWLAARVEEAPAGAVSA